MATSIQSIQVRIEKCATMLKHNDGRALDDCQELVENIIGMDESFARESLSLLYNALEKVGDLNGSFCLSNAVKTLLEQDRIDLALGVFGKKMVDEQCGGNVWNQSVACPNTFAYWAQPTEMVAAHLGIVAENRFDDAQKIAMFQGDEDVHPLGTKLRALLQEAPSLWGEMPISLIGAKHSPLRQAAMDFGWTPQHLPSMLRHIAALHTKIDTLTDILDYPYSVVSLIRLIDEREGRVSDITMSNERKVWKAATRGTLAEQSNRLDVAFGLLITALHKNTTYKCKEHSKTPGISQQERTQLQGILAMHASLDCLPMLLENLLEGRLELHNNQAAQTTPYFHEFFLET